MNEIAAYAGIFDGEGSVSIMRHNARRYTLRVDVCNTDPRLLMWFVQHFGGRLYERPQRVAALGRKTIYDWQADAVKAADFLRKVRPYLIVKAERADVAIAFEEMRFTGKLGHNAKADAATISRQADAHATMRALNGGRRAS